MRVLVCGDRRWWDFDFLCNTLDALHKAEEITCVIEGEAQGADLQGARWARLRNVPLDRYPADWATYGKAAGPIRNKAMLKFGVPRLVVAFHASINDSKGTLNMLKQAKKAGVETRLYPPGQMWE